MKEVTIKSWLDLAERIEAWAKTPSMFRGVVRESYELIPKIGRSETRKGRPYFESLEKDVFYRFKSHGRAHRENPTENDFEWLIIGQHHGLPTRLLDWTLSPFVAAYFAVEQGGAEGDAAMYIAQIPEKLRWMSGDPFSAKGEVIALAPPHISPRVSVQRSLLTLHPEPDTSYVPDGLVKAVVPQKLCLPLKGMLAGFGISRETLFPGLDGLCSYLTWELKWRYRAPEEP